MKTFGTEWLSPVGMLHLVASEQALICLAFDQNEPGCLARLGVGKAERSDNWVTALAKRELAEYFEGKRRFFSVPVDLRGTDFQVRAWQTLRTIPFGSTMSYQQQARVLGQAGAVRATGSANGRNPVAIIVPCHRVVRSDGTLGGYAGGLDIKAGLLALESR